MVPWKICTNTSHGFSKNSYGHNEINSLWPVLIWQQSSGSSLAQVMACCLMAPNHYLDQCWLIIQIGFCGTQTNFTGSVQDIKSWNEFEKYTGKVTSMCLSAQWVKWLAPGRYGNNLKRLIFKLIVQNSSWHSPWNCSQVIEADPTNEKSIYCKISNISRQT